MNLVRRFKGPPRGSACRALGKPGAAIVFVARRGGLDVEGLGIVYLEASAVGLPVVGGDSGGAPDAILDGETGYVVGGGATLQCGWVRDRFGVSWQIVPTVLPQLLGGPDAAGAKRAMQAMLGMTKLDIAELKRAYEGKTAA